jgi:hypothetical protein
MPRKKPLPAARHPSDAMAKFDRLLAQMAPKAEPPPTDLPAPPKRGKRRSKAVQDPHTKTR